MGTYRLRLPCGDLLLPLCCTKRRSVPPLQPLPLPPRPEQRQRQLYLRSPRHRLSCFTIFATMARRQGTVRSHSETVSNTTGSPKSVAAPVGVSNTTGFPESVASPVGPPWRHALQRTCTKKCTKPFLNAPIEPAFPNPKGGFDPLLLLVRGIAC